MAASTLRIAGAHLSLKPWASWTCSVLGQTHMELAIEEVRMHTVKFVKLATVDCVTIM